MVLLGEEPQLFPFPAANNKFKAFSKYVLNFLFTCTTAAAAHQHFLALCYKFKMSHINTDQSSLS